MSKDDDIYFRVSEKSRSSYPQDEHGEMRTPRRSSPSHSGYVSSNRDERRIPQELRESPDRREQTDRYRRLNALYEDDEEYDDDYFENVYSARPRSTERLNSSAGGSGRGSNGGSSRDGNGSGRGGRGGRRRKKGKGFIAVLLILLLCFGSVAAYGVSILGKLKYTTSEIVENEYIASSKLMRDDAVKNILFIGCDDAKGATYSRSDTMMLVSIDTKHKAIKLISFLRDSYLYIPGRDKKAKLNSACSAGGAQFVLDAIEYNFEIDIDHYVLVDFKMFENIVNALGGIDVEISEKEANFVNKYCSNFGGKAKEGYNHLNGIQALDYCRIRKLENETDFNRTARQRKVISEIIAKAKTGNVFKLIGKLDTVVRYVETDIPKTELVSLGAQTLLKYLRYEIRQDCMPFGDYGDTWWYDYVYGESIIALDVDRNMELVQQFIYE